MSADWILRKSLLHPGGRREYQAAKILVGMGGGKSRIPRMTLRDLTLMIFELPRQPEARIINLDGSPDHMWAFYTWVMNALHDDLYDEVNDLGGIDFEADIRDRITGAPICAMIMSPEIRHREAFAVEMRHLIDEVKQTLNNQERVRLVCIFARNDLHVRMSATFQVTLSHPMVVRIRSEDRPRLLVW